MFDLAEQLATQGYVCLTFDMRGHGASEGNHTVSSRKDFRDDVLAAYDFLVSQEEVDANRVIVIGSSFGSYMAALLSSKRKLAGLVLRVPADYRDEGFNEPLYDQRTQWEHSEWKKQAHGSSETAALCAVNAFRGDVLVVEAEKDEIVPAATVHSYVTATQNAKSTKHVVMKGAPHSISRFPEFQQEFKAIVIKWLEGIMNY
jgi:esterase/lipase